MASSAITAANEREIDTRVIDPAGQVQVSLFHYETPFGLTYGIQVEKGGERVHLFSTQDKSEALDLFRHPFTRPECPNVWARDFEFNYDDDSGSYLPDEEAFAV